MRKNITTGLGGLLVMLGALLAFAPELVHAQFTLYDDFNDEVLSPEKWVALQSGDGGLEIVRQIVSGKLHMAHRVVGEITTNTGANKSSNRLRFNQHGGDIIGVRFTMRVLDVSAQECRPSGRFSQTFAGLSAFLFSDTKGGIVGVFLLAERRSDSTDPENVLRIVAGLTHCLDSTCSTGETLSELDLGPLAVGKNVTLQMKWNEAKKQVRFRRNGAAEEVATYTQKVAAPSPSKELVIRGDAANCTAGERPSTSISVVFDNVSTLQ